MMIEQLDRINTLQHKIDDELKELRVRMHKMAKEVDDFKSPHELQDSADATRDYLVEMSEQYTQRIHLLDVKEVSMQYEERAKALESNATWKNLEVLKAKLRDEGQVVFELSEDIKTMQSTTDYADIKDECLQLVDKRNETIIVELQ